MVLAFCVLDHYGVEPSRLDVSHVLRAKQSPNGCRRTSGKEIRENRNLQKKVYSIFILKNIPEIIF